SSRNLEFRPMSLPDEHHCPAGDGQCSKSESGNPLPAVYSPFLQGLPGRLQIVLTAELRRLCWEGCSLRIGTLNRPDESVSLSRLSLDIAWLARIVIQCPAKLLYGAIQAVFEINID